ncbi:NADPH-dependent FMN reductase [Litchfieldella rifensis]|uniref:NADPH-dependent FMN reductase n=1 Tax=Litchfieldella rifensis TaxID=762643 RepID=A0ABV7LQC6_9GAMM
MHGNIRIAVIYGSVREGRFCDTVAGWVVAQVHARTEFALDIIDPAARRDVADDGVEGLTLRQRIGAADAFIVVTPEYNHSYPAALKALIDTVNAEWHAKPVAFVSYGGASGGLRAVEHLRTVFAELHAVGIRDSVSFPNAWEQFDAEGGLMHPARAERGMATMLSRLGWWAHALRDARAVRSYSEVVA